MKERIRIVKRIKKGNGVVFSIVLQNISKDILRYFTKHPRRYFEIFYKIS
jgi:hypothetical protein